MEKKEAAGDGAAEKEESRAILAEGKITKEELWEMITAYQGKTIYTAKGLPLTYRVKGGELFADRKKKSITRATFEQAYQKIIEDTEHKIIGPKSLNCFGAPYVWAVFKALGVV